MSLVETVSRAPVDVTPSTSKKRIIESTTALPSFFNFFDPLKETVDRPVFEDDEDAEASLDNYMRRSVLGPPKSGGGESAARVAAGSR